MTTQQLIYEDAIPVSSNRHAACSVETAGNYAFARHVNSLPLVAVEFPSAASEYTIIFAGDDKVVMPAVVLGLRAKENLYVTKDDAWSGKYIPAFARRYPFVFSGIDGDSKLTLCIDEAFKGFNREGRGAALFDAEGKPSAYVRNVLEFLQEYQAQHHRTREFCRKLKEHGLLDPMSAQVTTGAGEKMSLTGFQAVNRDRLKALPGDVLSELAKTDELDLIYLHLHSMRNFPTLIQRLDAMVAAQASTEPTAALEDAPVGS